MARVVVVCPYCSAETVLDDSEEYGVCSHCGFRIHFEKSVKESSYKSEEPVETVRSRRVLDTEVERMKDQMFSYFESGDIARAHSIAKTLLLRDSDDADAWYMQGVCILDQSRYPMDGASVKEAMPSFEKFTEITGLEVDIDAEAFKRYLKAADRGLTQYHHKVGTMYSRGIGVAESQEDALRWFWKAHLLGDFSVHSEITESLRKTDSEKYVVPPFMNEIWDGMFERTGFVSVELPKSVKSIGKRAFAYCDDLESVNLPSGLETIGEEAFRGCRSLRSVTIPESVEYMGPRAFYGSGVIYATVLSEEVSRRKSAYMKPGKEVFPKKARIVWAESEVESDPSPSRDADKSERAESNFYLVMVLSILLAIVHLVYLLLDLHDKAIVVALVCVLPATSLFCHFNRGRLLYAGIIDLALLIIYYFAGMVLDMFQTLTWICLADLVLVLILHKLQRRVFS